MAIVPNTLAFNHVLSTLLKAATQPCAPEMRAGLAESGVSLFNQMLNRSRTPPDCNTYDTLISLMLEVGAASQALHVHKLKMQQVCCAVLCCAVLCCAVLCCAVLCCAVLCCAVLCCAVLGWAGLGWAGLGWAGRGWAGLGWAGLRCDALRCDALPCPALMLCCPQVLLPSCSAVLCSHCVVAPMLCCDILTLSCLRLFVSGKRS